MSKLMPYDKYKARALGDVVVVRRSSLDEFNGYYGVVVHISGTKLDTVQIEATGHERGLDPKGILHLHKHDPERRLRFERHKYDFLESGSNEAMESILRHIDEYTLPLPDIKM